MTGRIAREEGIFAGNSAGLRGRRPAAAGRQLQAKRNRGGDLPRPRHALPRKDVQPRLDAREGLPRPQGLTARDLVVNREKAPHILTENAYSQNPVTSDGRLVGSVNEGYLYFSDSVHKRDRSDHAAGVQ
jgi:hypothetical protein